MDTFRGIDNRHFYHQVKLSDGTTTPGVLDPITMAPVYGLDQLSFKGKTVLDVGAWSGGWSFYAESRGASLVTAVDRCTCRYGGTEAFDMIKRDIGSKVIYKEVNAYNLWHAFPPKSFDIVFCFGVLYHLSDPAFALLNCVHAAREVIVVETVAKPDDAAYIELLPPREYYDDPSNITCPTTGWLRLTMHHFGWRCVDERPTYEQLNKGRCRMAMRFEPIVGTELPSQWSWTVFPHPLAN